MKYFLILCVVVISLLVCILLGSATKDFLNSATPTPLLVVGVAASILGFASLVLVTRHAIRLLLKH